MKRNILILFACIFITYTKLAYAEFKLTVSPQTSRIDINFGMARPGEPTTNQEVRIEVINDTGAQYRIIQQANRPLMNQFGKIIPESNFLVYAAQTSSYGIYRTEIPAAVTPSPLELYTSDSSGQSVSFLAVYGLNLTDEIPAGRYVSSITYTLQPLSRSQDISVQSVTLNVYVEVKPVFKMTITSQITKGKLNFRYTGKETPPLVQEVTVEIKSNLGSRYQVYQQLAKSLSDDTGKTIENEDFTFYCAGSVDGILPVTAATAISNQQIPIYTSDADGKSASFTIYYNLSLTDQKAGLYSGALVFICQPQEAAVAEVIESIEIFCTVEPIFKLSIISQEGSRGINFGNLKEKTRQTRYVTLQVMSNLGKQYQITQEVSGILMDRKGVVIPQESFTVSTEGGEKGTFNVKEPIAVKEGSTVVYVSNKEGDPEEITLVYQLSIPPDTPEGDYTTGISYSLAAL